MQASATAGLKDGPDPADGGGVSTSTPRRPALDVRRLLDARSLLRLVRATGRPTWTAYAVLLLLAEAAGAGPGWAEVAVAHAMPATATPPAQVRLLTPPAAGGPATGSAGLDAGRYHATLAAFDLPAQDVDPTPEQLHALAAIVDTFPRDQHRDAVRVAWCESRLDPAAVHRNRNGSSDVGVFQFNDGGTLQYYVGTVEEALDPVDAAGAAWDYVRERGWQPWTCGELMGAVEGS